MFNLDDSPYLLDAIAEKAIRARLDEIEQRVLTLRSAGTLTPETLRDYYGEKRFEQVAESNAIEGSTLSIGETELAVAKGITLTGHDPAYVRDAIALDNALTRVVELSRVGNKPTDLAQLTEIHGLLLNGRSSAGQFRSERVKISGSNHRPPKTWDEVMSHMEGWERWSAENTTLPAPIRSAVLHAWLTHIHPFLDGNGRTSRAVGNLELIRAGYPPIIFKKKERDRYIQALSDSDEAGDLSAFFDLVFDRIDGALVGLESSARRKQGYDIVAEAIKQKRSQHLKIWQTSVDLLANMIEYRVSQMVETVDGRCRVKIYEESADAEDYSDLLAGRKIAGRWAFIVNLSIPGIRDADRLAWVGRRSSTMLSALNQEGGPSLYWSHRNPEKYPPWRPDNDVSPYATEITSKAGSGDEWFAKVNGMIIRCQTHELADRIAEQIVVQASNK